MDEGADLVNVKVSDDAVINGFKTSKHVDRDVRTEKSAPDGGWGWVVVLATLTFNIIYDGCSYSFGILYSDLLDHFGDTNSNTAWIGSLFFSVPLLCAPLASKITNTIGSRKATMLGGLIAAVGFLIGAFSTSVWMLVIFYGLVGGFGMSLPYFNSLKTVTDYFNKRLALASGLAESGAGLGTVIFAPLTEYLVSTYGWRGTLIILSGIVANIIVCGALYRPVTGKQIVKTVDTNELRCNEAVQSEGREEYELTATTTLMSQAIGESHDSRTKRCVYMYTKDLKSIPFLIFAFSNFVMYFWYDVPYVFMFDRSVDIGISTKMSSYFLTIIGFVHLFGIVGYGIIGDFDCTNRELLYGMSTAFCGVAVVLVPLLFKFVELALVSGCFGLFSASSEALLACVLIDIVGKKAFDNVFCGLILFMEGIANLIGPPIAGLLFDKTGNYDMTFYTAGACVLFAGCSYVLLSCMVKKKATDVDEND